MKILGIETSCDETSCAVVEDGRKVLSNVIFSQIDLHAKTGGVVPEVAAREHILKIIPVLDEALKKAGVSFEDIDAIAVTKGPGLISSLIIGTETASAISYLKKKPLIPVHHIIGHIYANFLDSEKPNPEKTIDLRQAGLQKTGSQEGDQDVKAKDLEAKVCFPILVLTVSGGHNELILMKGFDDFTILGETRDDAAGEAFDKVARILGLGYPGGPYVSRAAEKGNREAFKFPRSYLEEGSLDFSFSGLKTAVLAEVKEYIKREYPSLGASDYATVSGKIPEQMKFDLSASFQEAAVDVLTDKAIQAFLNLQENGIEVKEIHLAGGVSANMRLREVLTHKINSLIKGKRIEKVDLRYPKSLAYCTDNAAMIAAAGYFLFKKDPQKFKPCSNIIPTTNFELF
jgi:N6-L-threonylcarbamoyladenine synthase